MGRHHRNSALRKIISGRTKYGDICPYCLEKFNLTKSEKIFKKTPTYDHIIPKVFLEDESCLLHRSARKLEKFCKGHNIELTIIICNKCNSRRQHMSVIKFLKQKRFKGF